MFSSPAMTVPEAFAHAQRAHGAGDFAMAESLYRQILAVAPQHADALHFLGVLLSQSGRAAEGLELLQRSLALNPWSAVYLDNLGTVLRELGRHEEAADCAYRALQIAPLVPETHNNLANALRELGRVPEALAHYERALQLAPGYGVAARNYALALREAERLGEALDAARRAAALDPSLAASHTGLGVILADLGFVEEADASFRTALQLDPHDLETRSAFLLNLHYLSACSAVEIAAEHRCWGKIDVAPRPAESVEERPADRPLRVGFVSPDFRQHPVGFFVRAWWSQFDPSRVTAFAYSDVRRADAQTAEFARSGPHWRETARLNDDELARQIRADEIDVLVDLAGYTADHRLRLFARRVAPVQATYLGYCDTTGLPTMDFRVTDAVADPPGESDALHTERLWRLPDCFTCYAPPPAAPAVSESPALRRGAVTFASFHGLAKLNGPLLETWAEILRRVPGSRLLVMALGSEVAAVRTRLAEVFASRGVAPERLEWMPRQPLSAYLAAHAETDLLLDSFPFGGHTASCHALWMGLPVVTRAGDRHAARMVASVLTVLGLGDWIASSAEHYVEIAVQLASDPARLAARRRELRPRLASSPLTDGRQFARQLEDAFLGMWRERGRAAR